MEPKTMKNDPKPLVVTTEDDKPRVAPFFARFLESQKDPAVQTDVKAGAWPPFEQTMKAPSDNDEW